VSYLTRYRKHMTLPLRPATIWYYEADSREVTYVLFHSSRIRYRKTSTCTQLHFYKLLTTSLSHRSSEVAWTHEHAQMFQPPGPYLIMHIQRASRSNGCSRRSCCNMATTKLSPCYLSRRPLCKSGSPGRLPPLEGAISLRCEDQRS
jgi:hypothetical protein